MKLRQVRLVACAVLALASSLPVNADSYRLPDPAELSTYSPDAMQFYTAGVKAIDKVDHLNAYSFLAKAAALEPDAVRLNYLAAALGIKHGRSKSANEAQDYYHTAIACYQNILKQRDIDDDFKREVQNRLKIAIDERDNLAKRDTRREALGGQFVLDLNKEFAPTPETGDKLGKVPASPTPAVGPAYAGTGVPMQPGTAAQSAPVYPGAPTPAYPAAIPTPGAPVDLPSLPGGPASPPNPNTAGDVDPSL